jgi:predicted negative regulator of RcsB-dependent stress response
MSLRTVITRIPIFVVALLALGGWSAWRLREMSGVTRLILSHNYDSVVAAQDMKESLERQDSAGSFSCSASRSERGRNCGTPRALRRRFREGRPQHY